MGVVWLIRVFLGFLDFFLIWQDPLVLLNHAIIIYLEVRITVENRDKQQ